MSVATSHAVVIPRLHVMAGALIDSAGRVLIAQRPAGKHMAGSWEFPGGKLEPGEARRDGLARELREELGVDILEAHPLIRITHRYPDREVLLDIWRVSAFVGEPASCDNQAMRWCGPEELPAANILPADKPAITALRLPDRMSAAGGRNFELVDFRALDELDVSTATARLSIADRLRGHIVADAAEAGAAIGQGADFIAFKSKILIDELASLCARANVPVYCRGLALEAAWNIGARGTFDLCTKPQSNGIHSKRRRN